MGKFISFLLVLFAAAVALLAIAPPSRMYGQAGAGAQQSGGGVATSVSAAAFPLLAPNGSVAAPSYSFTNQTGSGMYSNGTTQVLLASQGANIFALASSGGIGNSAFTQVFGAPPTIYFGSTADTGLFRTSAGILTLGNNGDSTGEFRSSRISATFNAAGTLQTAVHIVQDTATLSGGTVTVTLTGSAAFTNATSYTCLTQDKTAIANNTECTQTSGSSITITGTTTDVVRFILIGN